MRYLPVLGMVCGLMGLVFLQPAYAQIPIQVNSTQVCFLNYSAGADMWRNCGIENDYITFMLLPWMWITGGYFSTILVGIIVMISYIKYHKAVYPLLIGVTYLPFVFTLFPEAWMNHVALLAGFQIIIMVYYTLIRQTKEY